MQNSTNDSQPQNLSDGGYQHVHAVAVPGTTSFTVSTGPNTSDEVYDSSGAQAGHSAIPDSSHADSGRESVREIAHPRLNEGPGNAGDGNQQPPNDHQADEAVDIAGNNNDGAAPEDDEEQARLRRAMDRYPEAGNDGLEWDERRAQLKEGAFCVGCAAVFGAVSSAFVSSASSVFSFDHGKAPGIAWMVPVGGWIGIGSSLRQPFHKSGAKISAAFLMLTACNLLTNHVYPDPIAAISLFCLMSSGMFMAGSAATAHWLYASGALPSLGDTLQHKLIPQYSVLFCSWAGITNQQFVSNFWLEEYGRKHRPGVPEHEQLQGGGILEGSAASVAAAATSGAVLGALAVLGIITLWWSMVYLGAAIDACYRGALTTYHRFRGRDFAVLDEGSDERAEGSP